MQEVDAAVMRQRRGAKPDRELPRSSGHRTESYRFGSFRSSPLSSILRATECVGGKISRWSHAGFKLNYIHVHSANTAKPYPNETEVIAGTEYPVFHTQVSAMASISVMTPINRLPLNV
jgi:hypothetical protein